MPMAVALAPAVALELAPAPALARPSATERPTCHVFHLHVFIAR